MGTFGPSVGEPGYLPYCGGCSSMMRMAREATAFKCRSCGLETRRINGEDMFDRTAPALISARDMRAAYASEAAERGEPYNERDGG